MKANPKTYQEIAFGTKPHRPTYFNMWGTDIKCSKEVKLLGIYIDSALTFSKQITVICKKAGQQTCAIMRLRTIISMDVKLVMYCTFMLSNFNYCPVVWMLCGKGNIKKMEAIQLKSLQASCDLFFLWLYFKLWSSKRSRQPSISIHLITSLAVEVYKCLHNITPGYLCTLLKKHNVITYELRDKNQIIQKKFKTVTHGKRSFVYLDTKLRNSLPIGIKDAISLNDFKERIKSWDGPCDCSQWNET